MPSEELQTVTAEGITDIAYCRDSHLHDSHSTSYFQLLIRFVTRALFITLQNVM